MIILQVLATIIVILKHTGFPDGDFTCELAHKDPKNLHPTYEQPPSQRPILVNPEQRSGKFYHGSEGEMGNFIELVWLLASIGVPLLAIWIK